MRSQLTRLCCLNVEPNIFFDAHRVEYRESSKGQKLEVRATEVAELTLQKHGSAYCDYQSVSTFPIFKMVAYVGGINTSADDLIIGNDLNPETGNLGLPARLSLQDLIGYRTIEKIGS